MIINTFRIIIFILGVLYLIISDVNNSKITKISLIGLKLFNIKVNIINNSNINYYEKTPLIIMSNHYNFIDSMVIKKLNINSKSIAKASLLETININLNKNDKINIFSKLGLIPYYRDSKKSGLIIKKRILREYFIRNNNIIIYPEGTSTRYGKPKDFKNGIMKLCAANYMRVLPITIKYNKVVGLNKGDKFKITNLMDLDCTIYIHPIQQETNWIKLKQKVFHYITSV